MITTQPITRVTRAEPPTPASLAQPETTLPDIVETRLWLEEYEWLHELQRSDQNIAPTFRFPDLISACVALVFSRTDAPAAIFEFLGTQLVLRPPLTPRRRESLWREQYDLLQAIQRSPANRHPNPMFQLDQLTTTCVALCRADAALSRQVLSQARINMATRAGRRYRHAPA